MDTALAILRRKLAGVPMSTADANHIHHIVKRAVGGVKRAVVVLYGISIAFGILGVVLGALAIEQIVRLRILYSVSIVLFGAIGAVALKVALRSRWASQTGLVPVEPTPAAQADPVPNATPAATQPKP
jgi:UDP-GlcNAc:undecaprenyl-phosphate GlcNAc-1-phosphate transferase